MMFSDEDQNLDQSLEVQQPDIENQFMPTESEEEMESDHEDLEDLYVDESDVKGESDEGGSDGTTPFSHDTAENLIINSSVGFKVLVHAFKYLRVYELLRAARVCKMWNFIASHPSFWENVIMKNSMVHDWAGFKRTISKMGTKHVNLKKMIVPSEEKDQLEMWENFCIAISPCPKTLTSVNMGRCPPKAFLAMAEAAPHLESLVSTAIISRKINLLPLKNNVMLKELVVKSFFPFMKIEDFCFLSSLHNLTSLGLTSVHNLRGIVGHLPQNLVALELGDCDGLPLEMATNLSQLVKLTHLRLENGLNGCPTVALLEAIASLPNLRTLELINFDIKPGFEEAIGKCSNIKELLLAPTYFIEKAQTNALLLKGVAQLKESLWFFCWVVAREMLEATDLLLEGYEALKSQQGDNRLRRWVPLMNMPVLRQEPAISLDIMSIGKVRSLFRILLPMTIVQIRRVPYSLTQYQYLKDDRK